MRHRARMPKVVALGFLLESMLALHSVTAEFDLATTMVRVNIRFLRISEKEQP